LFYDKKWWRGKPYKKTALGEHRTLTGVVFIMPL
jgi:hypothetical protein